MVMLKKKLKGYLHLLTGMMIDDGGRQHLIRIELDRLRREMREQSPENMAARGFKVYSQCDEDGVIAAIFDTLGGGETLIEIGCGDGLENNTHALLLNGWRGVWVDGSTANIDSIVAALGSALFPRLLVDRQFIDLDNIKGLLTSYTEILGTTEPDLFSLDIDGNDLQVLDAALAVISPKVICIEYNAKFPPPMKLTMRYDAAHAWGENDRHGASIAAFAEIVEGRYSLLTCSLSGANAFFVRDDVATAFQIYPIEDLYQPLRLDLIYLTAGLPPTLTWLRDSLTAS